MKAELPGALVFDLLNAKTEDLFLRDPGQLREQILALPKKPRWVVIDEIQRCPRLLDTVHSLIESHQIQFALTGSSARKLKRGASNLLAGRAFVRELFPLTRRELGSSFHLHEVLEFGSLPKVFSFRDSESKTDFLESYALTYLKEEVQAEQLVRKIDGFRNFLEVAAQMNGEPLNFSKIGTDARVDYKTAQSFFEVLVDTLLGIWVEPYHRSARKRQKMSPKFYFFDTGVKRALDRTLVQKVLPGTYGYGKLFEHWLILEAYRLNSYEKKNFRFYYFRTGSGVEVDLILDRPAQKPLFVEMKSSTSVDVGDLQASRKLARDLGATELQVWCQEPVARKVKDELGVLRILPWAEALEECF